MASDMFEDAREIGNEDNAGDLQRNCGFVRRSRYLGLGCFARTAREGRDFRLDGGKDRRTRQFYTRERFVFICGLSRRLGRVGPGRGRAFMRV